MNLKVLSIVVVLGISMLPLNALTCPAHISFNSHPSNDPPWGFYNWQVDMNSNTAGLMSEMDFTTNPGAAVRIPIPATGSLACPFTVHEVHGTVVIEAQQGGSCSVNSMLAEVLDQNGNAIAAANLLQFGPSSSNIPIKATYSNPLSVSSLVLSFNLSPGCVSVLSWNLIMS
jgi:hypothetical protein